MIGKRMNSDGSVSYTVRVHKGQNHYEWVGSFRSSNYPSKRAALRVARGAEADAERRVGPAVRMTVDQYVERFLEEYERDHKLSSFDTAKQSLKAFREDFGYRQLSTITRIEAKDWTAKQKPSQVPIVVTLMNQAIEDELVDRNPFRGLGRRTKGRREDRPPTLEEFEQLRAACSVLGKYGTTMRALLDFAAYTAVRPGELYALEWSDVDFDRMRVNVERRLYRGELDKPKSGKRRLIALTPPARDAILGFSRKSQYVFTSKTGKRLSQPTLAGYWAQVLAKAGLDFDFYLVSRHYCAHYMLVVLGLPRAVVREQMGHVDEKLLDLYGHEDQGALERIDAAFADAKVVPLLRKVEEQ